MANWSTLKAAIANVIKTNGNQEITGRLLQNVLNNIVSSVGENSTFAGIATPSTNPGAPDGNVFYIASEPGTYSNFNGIEIKDEEAAILEWRGSWVKKITGFATAAKLASEILTDNILIQGNINNLTGDTEKNTKNVFSKRLQIKPNTRYNIVLSTDTNKQLTFAYAFYDRNSKFINRSPSYGISNYEFTSPGNAYYVAILIGLLNYNTENISVSEVNFLLLQNKNTPLFIDNKTWILGNLNASGRLVDSINNYFLLSKVYIGSSKHISFFNKYNNPIRIAEYGENNEFIKASAYYALIEDLYLDKKTTYIRISAEMTPGKEHPEIHVKEWDDSISIGDNYTIINANLKQNYEKGEGIVEYNTVNILSNKISIQPNNTYEIKLILKNKTKQVTFCYAFYDRNLKFIERKDYGINNILITSPDNAYYVVILLGLLNYKEEGEELLVNDIQSFTLTKHKHPYKIDNNTWILGNLNSKGSLENSKQNWVIPNYIPVLDKKDIIVYNYNGNTVRICQYDKNYNFLSSEGYMVIKDYKLREDTAYIRISTEINNNGIPCIDIKPYNENMIIPDEMLLQNSGLYMNWADYNSWNIMQKIYNTINISELARNSVIPITEKGAVFGHEGQIQIVDGIVYSVFLQNTVSSEDLYSSTSKIVLASFSISDYNNKLVDSNIKHYELGKLGDIICEGYTAKSTGWDPNILVDKHDSNILHIYAMFITNETENAIEFHRTFNISESILSDWELCTLDGSEFSYESVNKVNKDHGLLSLSDYNKGAIIEMVSGFTEYDGYFYNAVMIAAGKGRNSNNGLIVRTNDYINFNTFLTMPFNYNGASETSVKVYDNRLYVACRQYPGIPFLLISSYDFVKRKWGKVTKIRDGNVRPWIFTYKGKLYLLNTIKRIGRAYSALSTLTLNNEEVIVEEICVIENVGWYFATYEFDDKLYFVCKKDKEYFGELPINTQEAYSINIALKKILDGILT